MIYVASDIHGCYQEYLEMLEKINFNDNDTLYIIGDVCERGKEVINVLLHMMKHKNIIPIWGNHDLNTYEALSIVCEYANESLEDVGYMIKHDLIDYEDHFTFINWSFSEFDTLKDFAKLSLEDRYQLLEYLRHFLRYKEIEVNGQKFLLVHGGIPDPSKNINSFELEDLIWERPDYYKEYYKDKIIVSGHTPTCYVNQDKSMRIYKGFNNIDIDCGCVFGYRLACLCLDTMEEFYVESHKRKKQENSANLSEL